MENYDKMPTGQLEEILHGYLTGEKERTGDEVLAVCEVLAKREGSDAGAVEIYRRHLCRWFPDDMKK